MQGYLPTNAVAPRTPAMDRTLWPSVFLTSLVFLAIEFMGIDLWVQDHFYNFQSRAWLVDADAHIPRLLFYTGPKALIWVFALSLIAATTFYARFKRVFPRIAFARRDMWVVIATLATAPALVALGKATSDTFTPAQIRRYGGEVPYVKVIEHYPANDRPAKRGRAFPAGHASGGFALLSLAGLAATRRGRRLGITIGLTAGTAMGAYQMFKGAHYLSHTLVTAGFCWIVFLTWRRILRERSAVEVFSPAPDVPREMRLLIIEDNPTLRQSLVQYLTEASFIVDSTGTGGEGLWYATEQPYDAILLDLMLPEIDGIEILTKLRKKGTDVFILVISARDGLEDRLEALNAGADDYLTKPFPMSEALARIHALLRRKYHHRDPIFHIADLDLDPVKRTVTRAGQPVDLTALEYRLLEYLAFRSGEVVSRTEIWEHVFEDASGGNSNVADVYIGYLRKKLNLGDLPNLIHTRRGHGFMLAENPV
jgi:two-component system, OmpR family, copper resistance phosphate regulon response regulator CusR